MGRYLEGGGKIDEAVTALKRAIALDPRSAEPRAELAGLYARQDKASEALTAAEDALTVDPKNQEANRILGSVLAALAEQRHAGRLGDDVAGYAKRAMTALEIARADSTGDLSIDLALARLYLDADRATDAIPLLRRVVLEQPQYVEGSVLLAQAQRDEGDLDGAEATARALQAVHPEDVRATYLLGQILDGRGRYQDIVDLLKPEIARQKAAKAKGAPIAMLLGSEGLALQQLHRYDEAVAAFKEAIELAPEEPVRSVLLIQGYSAAGRHKDALEAAEQARLTFPDDTTVLYQLGAALDRAGRQPESEKVFRDVIARDPLDAGALNYLGYMLAEHGTSLDEAVTVIQRALKIEPDNPSFLDSLGWTYVQQGKLDLADAPLSTAAAKMPKNSVIQEHLGDLRQKQNRHADAIAAWQNALAGDGDSLDRAKVQKKIDAARKEK